MRRHGFQMDMPTLYKRKKKGLLYKGGVIMSMIQVQNLTFSYPGSFDPIFEGVNFQLDTDWKLGFIGRNGRGKSTFFQLLLGKYEYSGKINASVDFTYFPTLLQIGTNIRMKFLRRFARRQRIGSIFVKYRIYM